MCEIPCISRLARANMGNKKDGSKSDSELLAKVSDACIEKARKRRANWERRIAEKKRKHFRRKTQFSGELPNWSSTSNPLIDTNTLPGGSGTSFQNPLSTFSNPSLDSTITDTSESVSDLQPAIHKTDCLLQTQPNSINDSDGSSNFIPSCNSLYTTDSKEEPLCEQRIFQPNLPMDDEDEQILRDIRDVFVSEGMLNDSTSKSETLNVQQTVGSDVLQKPFDQDNQNCYDWDKFLDRCQEHHEHNTLKEANDSLPAKRSLKRTDSKSHFVPFNGQAKKLSVFAANSETSTSFKSTSPDRELNSSNSQFVLPSFENEMEIIVLPVSLNTSDTIVTSKLGKFIKHTEVKPLESQNFFSKTNGILRVDSTDSFKNQIHVDGRLTDVTGVTPVIVKELNGTEGDNESDTEIVS